MHDIGTSINIDKDCLHCEDIVLPESIWVSPGSKASVDCSYEIHVQVQIMLFMRCSIHALTLYSPAQVTLLGPSKFVFHCDCQPCTVVFRSSRNGNIVTLIIISLVSVTQVKVYGGTYITCAALLNK